MYSRSKICSMCKEPKALDDFYSRSDSHGDGKQGTCKECMKEAKKRMRSDPEKRAREYEVRRQLRLRKLDEVHEQDRKRNLARLGVTPDQYEDLLTSQDGLCVICQRPESATFSGKPRRLSVDHSHSTNVVRGLLCSKCNTALGLFEDNLSSLSRAITYLLGPGSSLCLQAAPAATS